MVVLKINFFVWNLMKFLIDVVLFLAEIKNMNKKQEKQAEICLTGVLGSFLILIKSFVNVQFDFRRRLLSISE
jgi:hypothetical protein